MKSICYIVPYFGKLPNNFQLWLNSCSTNNTIDWIIFTNDKTYYNYPENVKVNYCEFEEVDTVDTDTTRGENGYGSTGTEKK